LLTKYYKLIFFLFVDLYTCFIFYRNNIIIVKKETTIGTI